jgi:hypothetical protein
VLVSTVIYLKKKMEKKNDIRSCQVRARTKIAIIVEIRCPEEITMVTLSVEQVETLAEPFVLL